MNNKKPISYLLPDKSVGSLKLPVIQILAGGVTKYLLGGAVLDFVGHFLIFIGCLNTIYFLTRDKKTSFIIVFVLLGTLFLGVQIIFAELFLYILGLTPVFR